MRQRLAAYKGWAKTPDRAGRTAAARRASHHTRFLDQARRQNPSLSEGEIANVADSLKKAYYQELAIKSAQARRVKGRLEREAREAKRKRVDAAWGRSRAA
jgi:hypothetical protein